MQLQHAITDDNFLFGIFNGIFTAFVCNGKSFAIVFISFFHFFSSSSLRVFQ